MADISTTIPSFSVIPFSADETFYSDVDTFMGEIPAFGSAINSFSTEANSLKSDVNTLKADVIILKSETNTIKSETQTIYDNAVTDCQDVLVQTQSVRDATVAVSGASLYDAGTTYAVADTAIGTDGVTYRRINSSASGDNPVTSTTGNWVAITILTDYMSYVAINKTIESSVQIRDDSVAIGISDVHIDEDVVVIIGDNSEWRLI